jgi:hypothetical protein
MRRFASSRPGRPCCWRSTLALDPHDPVADRGDRAQPRLAALLDDAAAYDIQVWVLD